MWDSKEIAEQALRKAELIRKRRAARKRRIYSTLSVAVCLAVVVILAFVIPPVVTDAPGVAGTGVYGAAQAADGVFGGYVLLAVVSFALGCAVTIFCYKVLLKKRPGEKNENDGDGPSH